MQEQRPWHRLFGLSWTAFCRGMPLTVELEKDLSLKQQLLDVVLIRRGPGPLLRRLPDGFEELAKHNLISFKSYREALDAWALHELVGHYVNYRKQVSASMQVLDPADDFRLFAVSARFPRDLALQVPMEKVQEGVYAVPCIGTPIRVIVVHQLPRQEHNAMLHLFAAQQDLVEYGAIHYRPQSVETSSVLAQLFARYRQEGLAMPYTMEEFVRETRKELLAEATVKERLAGLSARDLLAAIAADELFEGLSADELIAALSPQMRAALKQRLKVSEPTADSQES